jgi:hypothetical protein
MANTAKLKKMNTVVRTEPMTELIEKAWEILDAFYAVQFARGNDEIREAKQNVTEAEEKLREALTNLEE